MNDLLKVRGLRVRYGATCGVADVELAVPSGAVVSLLGANGAGKSSILKGVAGLAEAEGEVIFAGRDLSRASARERVRSGIVYVPEGREIVAALTVDENLTLGGFMLDGRTRAARRSTILDLFPEISNRTRAPAWMLSGGEQQMLAIGRALMSAPRLLLLDEPSLGLAPLLIRRVFERLGQIRSETGLSILLVEQNYAMVSRFSDILYFVRSGQISGHRLASEIDVSEEGRRELLESYLGARH